MFEAGKIYKTRDGLAVLVVAHLTKHNGSFPIVGVITHNNGREAVETFMEDGRVRVDSVDGGDLMPPEQFAYLNVRGFVGNLISGGLYKTRERADEMASVDRVACTKVKLVIGQYDE